MGHGGRASSVTIFVAFRGSTPARATLLPRVRWTCGKNARKSEAKMPCSTTHKRTGKMHLMMMDLMGIGIKGRVLGVIGLEGACRCLIRCPTMGSGPWTVWRVHWGPEGPRPECRLIAAPS